MCNFFSGLWTRDGKLLAAPEYTDSHTDLITHFGLTDNKWPDPHFARVEFTPPDNVEDIADIDKWTFRLDEQATPSWFDDESKAQCLDTLKDRVSRMFVKDERPLLMGGCWILLDGAKVKKAIKCHVRVMLGKSELTEAVRTQVGVMRDSSQVGEMRESSQVGKMWGSSQVGEMWGSSQVGAMWGSSQVGKMRGSSQVGKMWGLSQVLTKGVKATILADFRVKS